jgi:SAM-dependent methyltransferase
MATLKNTIIKNDWESIHTQRDWGKYPNEELVRFIGRTFQQYSRNDRTKIKILELGCGQGANLWFLGKEGFDTYGIDISPTALKKTESYLQEAYGVKTTLREADLRKLPYIDEYFDIVIDVATIQHTSLKDHKIAYAEVGRVLKPNGYFWSLHIAKDSWGYGLGKIIDQDTFDNLNEGPLKDVGIICMPSDKDLTSILSNHFMIDDLEKISKTYENQKKVIYHWIIITRKK